MVTLVEMPSPECNPKEHPRTEALLALYDMATEWSKEIGRSHRDTFRLVCQFAEDVVKNRQLRQERLKAEAELAETRENVAETARLLAFLRGPTRGTVSRE